LLKVIAQNTRLKAPVNDKERIANNIFRLQELQKRIHELSYMVVASNSGGYHMLEKILAMNLVKGKPVLYKKLHSALIGENNSKIALDAPTRFQGLMREAEEIVKVEIGKAQNIIKTLQKE
jgi:hypothetical protein